MCGTNTLLGFFIALTMLEASVVSAEENDQILCAERDSDRSIAVCTRAIALGGTAGRGLAAVLGNAQGLRWR